MRLALNILCIFLLVLPAFADENLDEQYRDIQQQIKEQQRKLLESGDLEKSFLSQIEAIGRQYDETRKDLRLQSARIAKTREKVASVKNDIAVLKEKLDKQRVYLKRKLSSMQRYGNDAANFISAIVSARDFAQMMRNIRYLRKIAEYDSRRISTFKENLRKLDLKKQDLDRLYTQLKGEERELKNKEERLSAERQYKEVLLASVRKQHDGYRKMLDELTESSARLSEMLEQRASDSYHLTRFSLLKGRLPWPVNGPVAIPYGSYRDPRFKTPVFRRGVYIRAQEGMVARAIYSGKVVYADWFKGYGKVIILDHGGGYHSVYANLSEIFLRPGQVVKRRDAIGRVGDSGTIEAPALYFEMRYKGKPLNPLQWLDKR